MPFLLLLLFLQGVATANSSAQNNGYLNHKALTKELKALVDANKSLASMSSIGKTAEGRDLWLVTLGKSSGADLADRPGFLVGANFEGDHLVGSFIATDMIASLLSRYGQDETVTKNLNEYVFYFLPRMNPDGAERYFSGVKDGQRTNLTPYDGDNDGRIDEDGPDDLDGNGVITMMRVKDIAGLYILDPNHKELLKKADPIKGEVGMYKVFWEGIDNDGDGFINEDPVGGVDINRNFQHAYPYHEADAGIHMVSELESRAIMDWVLQHKNIVAMLNFGLSDNLLTAPNSKGQLSNDRGLNMVDFAQASIAGASKVGMVSTGRSFGNFRFSGMGGFNRGSQGGTSQTQGRSSRPARKAATTFNTADLSYFSQFSDSYKELTGIKTAPILREPQGAFFQFGYFQFGVLSFSTPGWGFPEANDTAAKGPGIRRGGGGTGAGPGAAPAGRMAGMRASGGGGSSSGSSLDANYLEYLKDNDVKGFVDWKSYEHPELGTVEIGGFTPYEMYNPDPATLKGTGGRHADFIMQIAEKVPKVKIVSTEVINHGGSLFRIKVQIENQGFLPTTLQHGVVSRSVAPTMVQLGVDPKQIMSGDSKTNFIQKLSGSGDQSEYEWLITGKKGDKINLSVVSPKAGSDTAVLILK